MKKLIVALFFICVLSNLGLSEDKTYKAMEFSLVGLNAADCYLTIKTLNLSPNFKEMNPLAQFYKNDALAVAINVGVCAIQVWGFEYLRKKGKTLGYVLMGAMILAKGYIIYNTIRQLNRYYART